MRVRRTVTSSAPLRQARFGLLLLLLAGLLVAGSAVLAMSTPAQAAQTLTGADPVLVAQETTTSVPTAIDETAAPSETTNAPSETAAPSDTASGASGQPEPVGQEAIVPPPAGQEVLNPGWLSDQMDVRVLPEFDLDAVLVIVGFSLPADVPLPATVKFPIPTGAVIGGIGEVGPDGGFNYNYTDSYPPVETIGEWDIATIEVTTYRQLQVDYYYDPGLPNGAGERSFPLLVQMPVDVNTLVLHVQEPARATDFTIQPPLQGSGQAEDGFTYYVGSFTQIAGGSTLGQVVSYYKPDAALSIESEQPTSGEFNTTTVLLAAILIVVIIVGGLVIYRLYSNSAGGNQKKRRSGSKQTPPAAAAGATNKRERRANKGPAPPAPAGKKKGQKGAKPQDDTPAEPAPADDDTPAEPVSDSDNTAAEVDGDAVEYCVSCGEELNTNSRFCPNCGEARP